MSTPITPVAVPLNISSTAGPTPTDPQVLWDGLLAAVAAVQPDYTGNLPLTLIEDVAATDVGALVSIDQARVDAINSVTPYGANPFILSQQGAFYGLPQGQPTNTSAPVIFYGPAGYTIPQGFMVSDGTYQYTTQEGAIIGTSGASSAVYAVAVQSGTWTPLENTINQIITALPIGYTITVTNPVAGTPGGSAESVESYRARVLQSAQATGQSLTSLIKSNLARIPGAVVNQISVVKVGNALKIICGGGDPYAVAYAIFESTVNWPALVTSTAIASVTITAGGSGYTSAPTVTFSAPGSGTTATGTATISGGAVTGVTITNPGSGYASMPTVAFSGGAGSNAAGTVNSRNITVSIIEAPDTYAITFVVPVAQIITGSTAWDTTIPSFTNALTCNALAQAALILYFNTLGTGQPINLLAMRVAFQQAVSGLLTPAQIDVLTFSIYINGVLTAPSSGAEIIQGDLEGYYVCEQGSFTVSQV